MGDPLHSRAACTQPCNVNTHSRAHCSPGARLCEQWGHGCVNNGARLCASAQLCRGSPVITPLLTHNVYREHFEQEKKTCYHLTALYLGLTTPSRITGTRRCVASLRRRRSSDVASIHSTRVISYRRHTRRHRQASRGYSPYDCLIAAR